MRPIISTRDLATAIGVSESSLKRWVDVGRITASRTAGGHRRITIGEAIRFIRAQRAPVVRPDVLGLTDLSAAGEHVASPDEPEERLFDHLCQGRVREARGLMLALYLSGESVAQIADGPLRRAMARIGELWLHDPAGVYVEHRAVDLCLQGVQQLRPFVEPSEPRLLAIGAAAPGDPYLLPSLVSATALAEVGWRTINLGPDTPFESVALAAERHAPRLVWLSISSVLDAQPTAAAIERLALALSQRGTTLIVGGRASAELPLDGLPLRRGASMADLVALAEELRAETGAVDAAGGSQETRLP